MIVNVGSCTASYHYHLLDYYLIQPLDFPQNVVPAALILS